MGECDGSQPEEWLINVHSLLDAIEAEAKTVANAISEMDDSPDARALRAEWGKFVGHFTETAIVISDMLERTMSDLRKRG